MQIKRYLDNKQINALIDYEIADAAAAEILHKAESRLFNAAE